ncbi:polyamine aminopropyltransferase [Clostridium aminobutyricum]|uniref:Polyamine aminopropyltransferase n=1 Tax=Clostridium aminobutyricum TaxID=33953 RepID=A0A939D7Q3_CLOAM|nr:polyamine aminopropyltransferase [Clostridium aminobutyricum]MBN7772358.1 polyamine aminopropyltransferase [Clostridium aminobutyricum]
MADIWFNEHHVTGSVKLGLNIQEILHIEKTPFQELQIYRNETFGVFMTLDGFLQVTEKDEFVYHDMISHPALAVNPTIKNVLIIGGGDGGSAREIARYNHIEKIDMVEIDGAVVEACKKYLPSTASVYTTEPRLNLIIGDGVQFVAEAADCTYDLILVDSTDPAGPGEGLFTIAFYENCYRILKEDGILINQHECAFHDLDAIQMQKAHSKIKKVFPIARVYGFNIPTYSTGYWYFGFASKKYDPIKDLKTEQWENLGLKTKYYNTDIHIGAFALPTYVKEILSKA